MRRQIPVGKLHRAKLVFGEMIRDRRFKIDPKEKDPLSPRFDWSKIPVIRMRARDLHYVPISSLPKAMRRQLLAEQSRVLPRLRVVGHCKETRIKSGKVKLV